MAITLADFNKIWASTSPLTPYSFSESNYKQGWNFIGSTPPARQMWDFLQKNNDEKMQYLANNYLPLTGGTMTGDITLTGGKQIKSSVDTSLIKIQGGTAEGNGARVVLHGMSSAGHLGHFELVANDGTNSKSFYGKPDGTLSWGGEKITVNSNIEDVTITTVTDSIVQTGTNNNIYRCGCVVTFGINAYVKSGLQANANLFTGLPKPKSNLGCIIASATVTHRCVLNVTGTLRFDGAGPTTADWFNGCITYITTD